MSRPGDHDEEVPFDPFNRDDDPFQPQRPLHDPLRPDPDPFPGDPFQLDDPFQPPSDLQTPPSDPRSPPADRTGAFEPGQGRPSPPSHGDRWAPPPPPAPRPEQPPGGSRASERQGQAPIPNRAARHQQKRRIPLRPPRRPAAPVVPGAPGTTGPFEAVRPERPGSTGEFPAPSTNGRADPAVAPAVAHEAPSRAERGARRSRSPLQARQLPSLPRFELPTGLARTTLGLAAILVLATTGLGVATNALPRARPPATPATAAPYSARWICPLLPNQANSIGVANVGAEPATLRTTIVAGSGFSQPPQKPLEPGGLRAMNVPAAKRPGYAQVEAFSAPIAVGSGGRASCASGPTDRWWIPAADTSLGASTAVVVANPDNDAAVVDLVPHVNQGALAPAVELFVPPRSAVVQTLSNGELIALKPAIEVIAKSGRVVAGAVIDRKGEQKIFVPGQPTVRPEWSFAGGLSGPGRSTSVLITNPSANPLSVSVQVSTDQGTFRPGNDFDNPIPGGSSAAIQVPPLRIRGSGAFALRISSRDGANFVAALRVTTPTAAGDVTYLDLGVGGSDWSWFVPQIPTSKQVVLANLGGGPVSARIGGPGAGKGGGVVRIGAGKVVVRPVPSGAKTLEIAANQAGLLVAPLGGGLVIAGAEIGGVPAGGPVVAGQAAA